MKNSMFLIRAAIAAALFFCSHTSGLAIKPLTQAKVKVSEIRHEIKESPVIDKTVKADSRVETPTPDFAFPKTVQADAVASLSDNLGKKDYVQAINSMIQIIISRQLINADNVKSCMVLCDSVARQMPSPYSGLARLVEARLLKEMYQNDKWVFDSRKLPQDSLPEQPEFWSSKMFRDKIISLVIDCCASMPEAQMPIGDISRMLTGWERAERCGLTVEDFMRMQAVDCLTPLFNTWTLPADIIPFTPLSRDDSEVGEGSALGIATRLCTELYDKGVSSGNPQMRAYLDVWLAARLNLKGEDPSQFLLAELETLNYEPESLPLLLALMRYNPELGEVDYKGEAQEDIKPFCTPEPAKNYFGLEVAPQELPTGKELYASLKKMRESITGKEARDLKKIIDSQLNWLSRGILTLEAWNRYYLGDSIKMKVRLANFDEAYIHVYSLPDSMRYRAAGNVKLGEVFKCGKNILSQRVAVDGEVPFSIEKNVSLPPLPDGAYAVILARDSNMIMDSVEKRRRWRAAVDTKPTLFIVSSLAVGLISEQPLLRDTFWEALVMDAKSGAPVNGAAVDVFANIEKEKDKPPFATGKTDTNGLFRFERPKLSDKSTFWLPIYVDASYKGSSMRMYDELSMIGRGGQSSRTSVSIFTDLSLFHPGDTVRFASIVYEYNGVRHSNRVLSGKEVQFLLKNPAYKEIESLTLVSDDSGRLIGSFKIPEECVLGDWQIDAYTNSEEESGRRTGRGYESSRSFQVAEYKVPSFFVSAQRGLGEDRHLVPDSIAFSGNVTTYTGMPLGGVKVDYEIHWKPFWWRYLAGEASYGGEVVTDQDGHYQVVLPVAGLKGTAFETGIFTFRATATAASGETQQSESAYLFLGNGLSVSPEVTDFICVKDKNVDFNVPVRDAMGLPVKKEVEWKLYDGSGKLVDEGEFLSPVLSIPERKLKSGSYKLCFHIKGNPEDCNGNGDASSSFVIWRRDDKVPAKETALWVDENTVYAEEGQKNVRLRVGTSYDDSHILVVITPSSGEVQHKWLHMNRGFNWLTVPVPADEDRTLISLYTLHDITLYSQNVTIIPHAQNITVKIETETFRDQLSAGEKEHWKFRVLRDGKPLADASALAVLSDKALDAIYPSNWYFYNSSGYWNYPMRFDFPGLRLNRKDFQNVNNDSKREWLDFTYPQFKTYGKNLFNRYIDWDAPILYGSAGSPRTRYANALTVERYGSANKQSLTIQESIEDNDDGMERKVENDAIAASGEVTAAKGAEESEVELRPVEMPVAFFKPSLNADGQGVVDIDFDVPNFNTTWKFRMLAYDSEMRSATLTLNTVAAKKVMVRSNPPSFLRTGDVATVSAMLFNNTGQPLGVAGRVEIYDPASGDVYLKQEFSAEELDPSGSRAVSVNWKVPSGISLVGMRFYAMGGDFSDGEQTLVVVLPSSSPVIESTPFWLSPADSKFSVDIPEIDDEAKVTLQYCANPMWYAVTSLPVRRSDVPEDATSLIKALFNGKVSVGLLKKYPGIKDAIKHITDNRTEFTRMLTSALERDPQLKILPLNLTPWTVDAAAETLRLASLSSLLDSDACARQNEAFMTALKSLQGKSGGFRWFKEWDEISAFATTRVLAGFALMRDLGCVEFTHDMQKMCDAAIHFMDDYYVKEKKKAVEERREFDPAVMIPYLYTRSSFSNPDTDVGGFSKLKQQALKILKNSWKKYDVYQKSLGAMLLYRSGMEREARSVVRSLGEFTSSSREKGVWFANEGSYYSPYSTLQNTASVLRAFLEIDPTSDLIEGLTQWLLLSRQTIDWGKSADMSAVIATVIKSAPGWLDSSEDVEIKVGDRKLNIGNAERYTGEFSTELDPAAISGKTLTVVRHGDTPAWGGVISRFTQTMKDVKEVSLPDLSVTKNIYPITVDAHGTSASSAPLKVGDRVRVTVTVHCGRDMQYVVINDELPACLRPVNQLSGYRSSERVWYNCQQRAATTSLMIPFLPKGDFIFTYECFVERPGTYSNGIVTVQSQYAPVYVAHSAGSLLTVE